MTKINRAIISREMNNTNWSEIFMFEIPNKEKQMAIAANIKEGSFFIDDNFNASCYL